MNLSVILMAAGIKWILIVLVILLLGGAVSYLLVKEKNRKDKAAQRAAERKAIRDRVLEEARSGNAQAFENLSVRRRPADQPVLSSEDSMRLAKLEKLENDLNALQNVGSTDSRRFSTTELNIAEASGEVVANEGADDLSVGIAALANGESAVDFRQLASQLDEVENKEAKIAAPLPESKEPQAAPAEKEPADEPEAAAEESKEASKAAVMAEAIVPSAAVLTQMEEPLDPEEEARKKVVPFTDTEDDFEELVFAPIAEVPEEESDYKPYRDEYEDLAEEAEKQAVLSGSMLGVPLPVSEQPKEAPAIAAEDLYDEAVVTEAPEKEPEENKAASEEMAEESVQAAPSVLEEAGRELAMPAEETIPEETMSSNGVVAYEDAAPSEKTATSENALIEDNAKEAEKAAEEEKPEEPLLFSEKDYPEAIIKPQEPAKMYDTMGFTMSLEMQKLSDEERRAAREARMAEKAKYAAALAGEGDYMPEEEEEEDLEDEDLDLEDEEKISVGRVILWIFAAILSLVCVGAILYLMFGSFFSGISLTTFKLPVIFQNLTRFIR